MAHFYVINEIDNY